MAVKTLGDLIDELSASYSRSAIVTHAIITFYQEEDNGMGRRFAYSIEHPELDNELDRAVNKIQAEWVQKQFASK